MELGAGIENETLHFFDFYFGSDEYSTALGTIGTIIGTEWYGSINENRFS